MRITTTLILVCAAIVAVHGLAPFAHADNFAWADPVDGIWSDPANWVPEQVPGPGDGAFITVAGTYTVTMDVDADVSWLAIGSAIGNQTLDMDGRALSLETGSIVQLGAELRLTNGSSIAGTGTLNNGAALALESSTISCAVNNSGEMTVAGNSAVDGLLTTTATSTIRMGAAASLTVADGFTNNHFILLLGDGASLSVTSGTLVNVAGSFINSSGPGGERQLAAELDNQGTIGLGANLRIEKASAQHSNSGTIFCLDRDLSILQSGTDPSFTNSGAIRIGAGRTVTVDGGVFVNAPGGSLEGDGVLDVSTSLFQNSGTLSPGVTVGALDILGDFAQLAGGTLAIEIGGLGAGTEFDLLQVSGNVSFDGTLAVSLVDDFMPSEGDLFEIVTYGSHSGAFSDTSSLVLSGAIYLVQQYGPAGLTLATQRVSDMVIPQDPGICLTPYDPCLEIPFDLVRAGVDAVRAYSVTFSLSPELQLCEGLSSIREGTFLSDYCGGACTFFQADDNGDGTYTVDCTILGSDCGPTGSGTLLAVDVTHTGEDGVGEIAITDLVVRDCDNESVPVAAGDPLAIGIDVAFPPEISDLGATQIKIGNDDDGTTAIRITFTGDTGVDLVQVFRKGFGDYPEYDDGTGSEPQVPATPEDALAEGWTLTVVTASGQLDEPGGRDYWYYIMFVTSTCDLTSASNMTDGTLNYHLGDVSDGLEICSGDNLVNTVDISLLGAHYFEGGAAIDSVKCLDVGPTVDHSVDGRPTTDDEIDFEDLVIFGMNFGEVGLTRAPMAEIPISPKENPRLTFAVDGSSVAPGGILTARLALEGNQVLVKGIHSRVTYDQTRLTLVDVIPGDLLAGQPAPVSHHHQDGADGVWFDAVVLGGNRTFHGSGVVAVYRFQITGGTDRPSLALADLRDAQNSFLLDAAGSPLEPVQAPERDLVAAPAATQLLGARPNPFAIHTSVAFRLSDESQVALRIHDVGGRLVRTLVNERLAAGEHWLTWDGRDDAGQSVSTGLYFCRLRTGTVNQSRSLFLFR